MDKTKFPPIGNIDNKMDSEEWSYLNEILSHVHITSQTIYTADPMFHYYLNKLESSSLGETVDVLIKRWMDDKIPVTAKNVISDVCYRYWSRTRGDMSLDDNFANCVADHINKFTEYLSKFKLIQFGGSWTTPNLYKHYELILDNNHIELKYSKYEWVDSWILQSLCYFLYSKYIRCYDEFKNINTISVFNIRRGTMYSIKEPHLTKELISFALEKIGKTWSDLKDF